MRSKHVNSQSLRFGLDEKTGEVVFINDVKPRHTNLVCPAEGCRWPLTAVSKATQMITHFRHKPESNGGDRKCENMNGVFESVIHKLAKQIIINRGNIYLFPFFFPFKNYKGFRIPPLKIYKFSERGTKINLEDIAQEQRRISKDYQPDIVATYNKDPIVVEIYYRHLTGADKIQKIVRDDVPAIEISLNRLEEGVTPFDVDRALINPDNFKWLHYPDRWLTGEDKSKLKAYLANKKNSIDEVIEEKKRQEKEKVAKRLEDDRLHKEAQLSRDVLKYRGSLISYLEGYTVAILKFKKVTPFEKSERKMMKDNLVKLKSSQDILSSMMRSHNGVFKHSYYEVVTDKNYEDSFEGIGDAYRERCAKNILSSIPDFDMWIEAHLIGLYRAGWHNQDDLSNIYNFNKNEGGFIPSDGYSSATISYLKCEIFPECKRLISGFIKGSGGI